MKHLASFLVLLGAIGTAFSQTPTPKPVVPPSVYDTWEYLSGARISPDGRWTAYGTANTNGETKVAIKSNDTKDHYEINNAGAVQFTPDSRWCAYLIRPPREVAERIQAEKQPVDQRLGIRDLNTGVETTLDHVRSFEILLNGRTIAVKRSTQGPKPEGASDLTFWDLPTGGSLNLGNVVSYLANQTGDLVLVKIISDAAEQGVDLVDPVAGKIKTLTWGVDRVEGINWAYHADVVGYLIGHNDDSKDGAFYRVEVVSDLRSDHPKFQEFDPATHKDFPKGKRIAPYEGASVSRDGHTIGFGVQEWHEKTRATTRPQDNSNVIVWNTKDIRPIPVQRVFAGADRARSDLWIWRPSDDAYREISKGDAEQAFFLEDGEHALLIDRKPYLTPVTNGFSFADLVWIDPWANTRKVVAKKMHSSIEPSVEGRYVSYFAAKNWWVLDGKDGSVRSITAGLGDLFEDKDDDHLVPEKPAVEGPAWMRDDQAIIVHDKFDAYLVKTADWKATKLTNGKPENRVYRFEDINPKPEGPALSDPMFFRARDLDDQSSGYYSTGPDGKGKLLFIQSANVRRLQRAGPTDRVAFAMGSFEKSTDIYVTNLAFSAIKQVTHTNPQQANYAWGKSELISYKSRWGKPLKGILIYPANYDKTKSYPMVTYVYERQTEELNDYVPTSSLDPYNVQILSQTGYFVLKPDIAYRGNHSPGIDAVDCIEPAVDAVLAMKLGVDAKRVGLMGHSWGGYETAFVTTVSKKFAVGVAGAPVTELTSMYNSYYWNTGTPDQELFETGQARMGVPFWDEPKAYIENSPVWRSKERTTPLLMAAGDADGAVDWHQSLYLYNTLRRLGKPAVFLLYPGENHGLERKAVRRDYSARVRHYLEVYLKGVKPEAWISDGVPLLKPENAP